jgi:SAM-dependent methyltransferase
MPSATDSPQPRRWAILRAMSFEVTADAYARFMGRFSEPLAATFADFAGVAREGRALDVGCGPGALTAVLADRLGPGAVAAVDPSAMFVAALRDRLPGVDVRAGGAEALPFADGTFDVALAQLVVLFMADPVTGLGEMARVTRADGVVAASVWDHAGSGGPLALFWRAAHDLDPDVDGEAELPGTRDGHLAELCAAAGLHDIESAPLTVTVPFATVDEWWEPYTLGVGPAGVYVGGLDDAQRDALRARCAALLPPAPFEVDALAWCVRARA